MVGSCRFMARSFPDTRWSLIQKARVEDEDPVALDEWCRSYWPPVHSYICSKGYDVETARELTQSFFEKLIKRGAEASLPEKLAGAFRAYVRRSVQNFLTDQWRSSSAERRGGGLLQAEDVEMDTVSDVSAKPDRAFDQKWVLALIERAMEKLGAELRSKDCGELFEKTRHLLDGRRVGDEDRAELIQSLGMTDGAFRVALYRMRNRFRALIEEEVRETVSNEEEFQEELSYLFEVWS